jgi:hypothetical protein
VGAGQVGEEAGRPWAAIAAIGGQVMVDGQLCRYGHRDQHAAGNAVGKVVVVFNALQALGFVFVVLPDQRVMRAKQGRRHGGTSDVERGVPYRGRLTEGLPPQGALRSGIPPHKRGARLDVGLPHVRTGLSRATHDRVPSRLIRRMSCCCMVSLGRTLGGCLGRGSSVRFRRASRRAVG